MLGDVLPFSGFLSGEGFIHGRPKEKATKAPSWRVFSVSLRIYFSSIFSWNSLPAGHESQLQVMDASSLGCNCNWAATAALPYETRSVLQDAVGSVDLPIALAGWKDGGQRSKTLSSAALVEKLLVQSCVCVCPGTGSLQTQDILIDS